MRLILTVALPTLMLAASQPSSGEPASGPPTTPGQIVQCNFGGHSEENNLGSPFTGKVISPSAIAMSGFFCTGQRGYHYKYGNVTGFGPTSYEGPRVILFVKFRDPKDTAQMKLGEVVRLRGDVYDILGSPPSIQHRNRDRLVISDARFADQ